MFSNANLPIILKPVGSGYASHKVYVEFNHDQRMEDDFDYCQDEYDEEAMSGWENRCAYYLNFVRHHGPKSLLSFGQYKGIALEDVVIKDIVYFQYCLREVDRFFVSSSYLIELCNTGIVFTEEVISGYFNKRVECECYSRIDTILHNKRADKSNNDDGPDYNKGNSGYNDNLDMDQQGQDYWESMGLW